ncbi:pimeloyl-ACP methyl ester carboxylesterase [Kineosporia succinea]|uniref:Pimeloyl-ACP methyl ester carboxylesterase n=1 Tax=Kineosporia succinea TaxID=84632 RepID=A0ABT9PB45_9ACTN|nr:pimeloyl-ACP methyl ester carboxylesterase [Kineosporia succinea]
MDGQGQGLGARSPKARWARPFDAAAYASEPSGVASIDVGTAAGALIEQIRRIGSGDPCVVVAHSAYGAVATEAAEREPSLFSHLVYVAAFAPTAGMSAAEYVASPQNEGETGTALGRGNPFELGASRLDPADGEHHEAFRTALYADVEKDVAVAAIGLLNPDAPMGWRPRP